MRVPVLLSAQFCAGGVSAIHVNAPTRGPPGTGWSASSNYNPQRSANGPALGSGINGFVSPKPIKATDLVGDQFPWDIEEAAKRNTPPPKGRQPLPQGFVPGSFADLMDDDGHSTTVSDAVRRNRESQWSARDKSPPSQRVRSGMLPSWTSSRVGDFDKSYPPSRDRTGAFDEAYAQIRDEATSRSPRRRSPQQQSRAASEAQPPVSRAQAWPGSSTRARSLSPDTMGQGQRDWVNGQKNWSWTKII